MNATEQAMLGCLITLAVLVVVWWPLARWFYVMGMRRERREERRMREKLMPRAVARMGDEQ